MMRTARRFSVPFALLAVLFACGEQRAVAPSEVATDVAASAPAAGRVSRQAVSADGAGAGGDALQLGTMGVGDSLVADAAAAPPAAPGQPVPNAASSAAAQGAAPAASLIIRTGTASVEVDSLEPAVAAARVAVGRVGGWVANASFQGGRDQVRSATLELKVPAARFDALTNALGTIGELERLDVSAEDVGEEYVDVTARVANARRLEARLIDLLARSAGRLSDVLAVERELARVREEIERYEGRLRFLRTRAATSTLTVSLHEPPPLISGGPGENPIAGAVRRAWRNFVDVVAWLIASLGVVVPLALVGAAVWVATRPLRRRLRAPVPPGGATPPAQERRDRAA